MKYQIPQKLEKYPEREAPPALPSGVLDFEYTTKAGDEIDVVLWSRFPSYDFIFGVPKKGTPRHEKEVGYFVWRYFKGDDQKELSLFVDIVECEEIICGFKKVLTESRTNSKELWKEHNLKNE